ncbi:MAG: PspA/IM30 family protein [Actinobacteria bacterium]|nr:PspA/IM30 family protein [Actinomycetota bacterium]
MLQTLKKWWKYLGAKLNMSFNEKADPKVQLEQAISQAQDQHRRLKEQATNVIANQKLTEKQLNDKMGELETLNSQARQAVLMADEAGRTGDAQKALEYTHAAEAFANRLIALESEIEGLKNLALQAAQASDQAKAAVQQNSANLQRQLAEKQKLLSQLDQAKMQEQMNVALSSLSETVGQDVPTLSEISAKIDQRYAKAMAGAELQGTTVESRMLEVQQAAVNVEAQARLEQIRSQLGIAGESSAATAPAAAPAESPAAASPPEAAPQAQPEPAPQQTPPPFPPAQG